MKTLTYIAVALLGTYLFGALIAWDWNPGHWWLIWRLWCALWALVWTACACALADQS